jgi:Protein of unknown function (DUF2568)
VIWRYAAAGYHLIEQEMSSALISLIGRRFLSLPIGAVIALPIALFSPVLALLFCTSGSRHEVYYDCCERLQWSRWKGGAIIEVIKSANVALRFLLELCVLAALGYWGFQTGQGLLAKIGLGIGVPLIAAVVWGLVGAPGSPWQLHDPWHLVLEVVVFGAAAVALFAAGSVR